MIADVYRKLKLESLEQKKLLAGDIGLTDDGILEILGTENNDTVEVSQKGKSIIVKSGDDVIKFESKAVKSLSFVGGDGDD
ncbi:MAG: hypothetical protein WBD20_20155, partial [Pirellulaceae bacterium]